MSASLVGSEMCIRDSRCTQANARMQGRADAPMHRCTEARRHCRTTAPVSYTHLTLPTICSV
eukprot:11052693-Alexandrium_andersonii.AAC.1